MERDSGTLPTLMTFEAKTPDEGCEGKERPLSSTP